MGLGLADPFAAQFAAEELLRRTNSRTLYVSPSGAGDGSSAGSPTTLEAAVDFVFSSRVVLDGLWTIQMAAGTYPAPTWPGDDLPKRLITNNYLKLVGPTPTPVVEELRGWDGAVYVDDMEFNTPGEPTAVIDADAGGETARGIKVYGWMLWLENIETKGFSVAGLDADAYSRLVITNHWDRESARGRYFKRCRYSAGAGRLIDNTIYGVSELFGVTRDYTRAEIVAAAYGVDVSSSPTHQNNAIPYGTRIINSTKFGLHAKEHCHGHFDYLTIEDCPNALSLHTHAIGNVGNLVIRQGPLARVVRGITLTGASGIHEYYGIEWNYGTVNYGSQANIPKPIDLKDGSYVLDDHWVGAVDDDLAYTDLEGRVAARSVKSNYTARTYTGTTAETDIDLWTMPAKRLAAAGSHYEFRMAGVLNQSSSGSAGIRFLLRLAGTYLTEVAAMTPQTSGRQWELEAVVRTSVDGGTEQLVTMKLLVDGQTVAVGRARVTLDYIASHGFVASVILASAANSITVDRTEHLIT